MIDVEVPHKLVFNYYNGRNRIRQVNCNIDDIQEIYFFLGTIINNLLNSNYNDIKSLSIHIHTDTYILTKNSF